MIELPERGHWQKHAACRGADPDLFYPGRGGDSTTAKKICDTCPVAAECLQHAIEIGERSGIWGGLSERQRRRRRATPPAQPRPTVCTYPDCTNLPYAAGRCRRHHRRTT